MSVVENNYQTPQTLSPRYLKIEYDPTNDIIIIDDVGITSGIEVHYEIDRDEVWIKVNTGFELTIIDSEPSSLSSLASDLEKWSEKRLFVQTDEVILIEYDSDARTTQTAVTGYEFGSGDTIYIKIDRDEDTVSIYHD
ncbi:MAG: hypothetical protein H6565_13540 [Lewinellaceae bacterium]|nr:hypothetical protein [Lewinellaceae bacterium]